MRGQTPTCNIAKSQGSAAAQCEQRGIDKVEKRLWLFRAALSVLTTPKYRSVKPGTDYSATRYSCSVILPHAMRHL
jgi:hypothetical protein